MRHEENRHKSMQARARLCDVLNKLKGTLQEGKLKGTLERNSRQALIILCDDVTDWLAMKPDWTASEIQDRQEKLENAVNPLILEVYTATPGYPPFLLAIPPGCYRPVVRDVAREIQSEPCGSDTLLWDPVGDCVNPMACPADFV